MVYSRLYRFEIKIGILHENQSEFQPTHSGDHIILDLVNSLYRLF